MDESLVAENSGSAAGRNKNPFPTRVMGVSVSIVALAQIVERWGAFSSTNKFIAILFLFLLVSSVVSEFTGKRKGLEFLARDPVSPRGYVLIMLATVLIGLR